MNVAFRVCAPGVLFALTGCGSDAPSSVARPPVGGVASFVHLVSEQGDALGAGATYDYSTANALVTVRPLRAQLAVRVVGDRVWDGFLDLSSSELRLRTGTFANLTNAPASGSAGFRWSSQETTCATSVASVTIDSLKYDGSALSAIDLRFEQRCGGQSALRGTVHWRAADDPNAPGPVLPIPAALWRAPAGSTPTTGSYVYLAGDAGLIPGVTLPQTIVPAPGTMGVSAFTNRLSLVAADSSTALTLSGTFQETIALTSMQEGYHRDLRAPFEDVSRIDGLRVSVNGQGCASLIGWFVIDHVFYFQGNLTAIDLRFEVRCGGFGAPLRGQIHWAESGA